MKYLRNCGKNLSGRVQYLLECFENELEYFAIKQTGLRMGFKEFHVEARRMKFETL